ncbi:AbiTii domain-containing protein [Jeotgalicoccus sp. FSL K6-3177]|uniref:AbiTii domain-containing protein n=1 Tax=Jeotgalicoccus sp. FSL K6-3177 TaxID=2921494 RepID=UPI0030FD6D65
MAKSYLIKDLTKGEISLINALERLLIITYSMENLEIKNWVMKEISGYKDNEKIPNYREHKSMNFTYQGINGQMQVKNAPLPITCFPEELQESVSTVTISEGVGVIEKIVNKNYRPSYDLTLYAPYIYEKTGIQCLSITHNINSTIYEKVYSTIRLKVIQILLDLEKSFGVLDDLDINTGDLSKEEIKEVERRVISIIADGKELDVND